jgi:hypothetical protein
MSNGEPIAETMAEMLQSILATPKHQRRLKSGTFWERLGFEKRTPGRVKDVRDWLQQQHVIINLARRHSMLELANDTFGSEDKDDWIILTYVQPDPEQGAGQESHAQNANIPTPPESWFARMEQQKFESENEVVCFFIVPMFEQLGWDGLDFYLEYPIEMYEGVKRVTKEADLVIFNGENHIPANALIDVEAKKPTTLLDKYAVGQARSYATSLRTPYYVLTNGENVRVYLFQAASPEDALLMDFKRTELRLQWSKLYEYLSKQAVLAFKERRSKSM